MIKVDHSQAPQFEEFKNGFYEAVVTEVKPTKTKGGKPMLVFNYIVRDDVNQPCKKKQINFDNFVIQEDNEYFPGFFNQRSKAYGIPNGVEFATYTEWGQSVVGNAVKLKVEAVQSGQYVNANVVGWYPTEHPLGSAPATEDPFTNGSGPINVSDEDLPF
ncbi:hypothetical protein BN1080_02103 [Planococcus massiliensis]|uniref:Single-stranded DNA-binding protein n=1 Tax=Planococcus massiliensis TaxID=1499687 RepID=A0A098ELG5_9BACL|nr:DUF669 domain-containing protein [Planococcus massiliensis]CEG23159.1 hypothetical protein BN1080_02103 [Planococcus massiliensis]